jgi:hypothetical protein
MLYGLALPTGGECGNPRFLVELAQRAEAAGWDGDTGDPGFGLFGEPTDDRTRARRLDEGLAILAGLWSGEPFAHAGEEFTVEEVTCEAGATWCVERAEPADAERCAPSPLASRCAPRRRTARRRRSR